MGARESGGLQANFCHCWWRVPRRGPMPRGSLPLTLQNPPPSGSGSRGAPASSLQAKRSAARHPAGHTSEQLEAEQKQRGGHTPVEPKTALSSKAGDPSGTVISRAHRRPSPLPGAPEMKLHGALPGWTGSALRGAEGHGTRRGCCRGCGACWPWWTPLVPGGDVRLLSCREAGRGVCCQPAVTATPQRHPHRSQPAHLPLLDARGWTGEQPPRVLEPDPHRSVGS